jgi:hypothetical protein
MYPFQNRTLICRLLIWRREPGKILLSDTLRHVLREARLGWKSIMF